jgi:hypothetical protein
MASRTLDDVLDLSFDASHEHVMKQRDAPRFRVAVAVLASHPLGLATMMESGWLTLLLEELEELKYERELLLAALLSGIYHPRLRPLYLLQVLKMAPAACAVLCAPAEQDSLDQAQLRVMLEGLLRSLVLDPALAPVDDRHYLALWLHA